MKRLYQSQLSQSNRQYDKIREESGVEWESWIARQGIGTVDTIQSLQGL